MPLAAGSRLGPYEVIARLGAGAMGEVYRARDARLGREVAIKVLPADFAADPERLRRFEKEARAASALNHPNIVTIFDIGSSGSTAYIAMERVEGQSLREILSGGALPARRLLPIAAQIAEGLSRAHRDGIVHRDLKPENVMVTKDGLVKILDFGLAKRTSVSSGGREASSSPTETGTEPGTVLGTADYMSPEQAAGQPVDFRSDQFSLGSILYEMATGRRAFQRKTAVDTMAAILNEEPAQIASVASDTPTPLCWIVERCIAKDPEGRYDSTRDLARELEAVSAHFSDAAVSGPAAAVPGARRRAGTRRVWVAVAALAVGAVAGRWLWKSAGGPSLSFQRVTYLKTNIRTARIAPDGQTVVYAAFKPNIGDSLFLARPGSRDSRPLGIADSNILSISSSGEMALAHYTEAGPVLTTAPIEGEIPREILQGVESADWAPDGKSVAIVRGFEGSFRVEFPIGKMLFEGRRPLAAVRVSPGGDRIAFREVNGSLLMVDRTGKQTRYDMNFDEFAWSPTGKEIWFNRLTRESTELRAIALDGRERLMTTLPGDFALQDVSRRGSILLERGDQRWDVLGKFPGDENPHPYAWQDATVPTSLSPDGKTLLFVEKDPGWKGGVTYKRQTDASAAVPLGEGFCRALSPDGKWAVCREEFTGGSLFLMPTGPGERKPLPDGGLELRMADGVDWLPDGSRIVFSGNAPGRRPRIYTQSFSGGLPVPITPEGVVMSALARAVSPDGRVVVGLGPGGFSLYPIGGGEPEPIPGRQAEDRFIQWTPDGRGLYLYRADEPDRIWLLELSTGKRVLRQKVEIRLPEPSADPELHSVLLTPDGESYVYTYSGWLSDLYVLDGLK
jgi:Tol biopolymer transport system component